MHAEKCPVCNGTGKVDDKQCHGCAGLGWVSVQDTYPIYYPPYQPCQPCYPPYQPVWVDSGNTTYYPPNDTQWQYTNKEA